MNLPAYLDHRRRLVENALEDMLPKDEIRPEILHKAMRYSMFAGGKRIRPILAMAASEAVGREPQRVLPLAVALECIHTYSLVHDDLPAMDDDDLRRGKPTSHKVFGEAIAVLAGDALLTSAFQIMGSAEARRVYRPETLLAVISELALAAGPSQLIAGQVADITNEGRPIDADTVEYIVKTKTGALIRASLACGAMLAGGTPEQVCLLSDFGDRLGAAFQIRDDLLDLDGDPLSLGKAVNKDQVRGKATYPALLGKEKAKEMVKDLIKSAIETINPLGPRAEPLAHIGRYIRDRMS